jgi:hypothetical protein
MSTLVGLSIMGASTPMIMQASLAPVIAQKRADNFGEAEALAVSYSAKNEGQVDIIGQLSDKCELTENESKAYTIKCTVGQGQFIQHVSRSFRLAPENTGYTNPNREFAFEAPLEFSHVQCLATDPWGVIWYNDHLEAGHMDACIPAAGWSQENYFASNPNDWLFDLSDFGFGQHPDY